MLLPGSKSGILLGTLSGPVVIVALPARVQLELYEQMPCVLEYAGISGDVPHVPVWGACAGMFQTISVNCRSVWFGKSGECHVNLTWPWND